MTDTSGDNRHILIVDDNLAIHEDFRKILGEQDVPDALNEAEAALFGEPPTPCVPAVCFQLTSAQQGQEALEHVRQARAADQPFAVAFIDIRMPPGWDGVETALRLWEEDPELQVVICTAYSDYSWESMTAQLGRTDRWLILKKPFDTVAVSQFATALTEKWNLARLAHQKTALLEQVIQHRTRELQEQNDHLHDALERLKEVHTQLLQADKMASIGQLAAGVAHEINNPIGFISSNLNTLRRYVTDLKQVLAAHEELVQACATADSPVAEHVAQLRTLQGEVELEYILGDLDNLINESIEGTQRVRQIVADLRDFSHIDQPDANEEDLNRLLDKTINVAWNELKYKAELQREYGELPLVACRGGQMGQVFLNLLVNAAHAIPERGAITVRTGQADDNVWIEVADTGCGIPPENLPRIFEPFFTTKDVGQGTGMGLHLCYRIIEAHGGRISVQSTVGQGTTFRVELPLTGPIAVEEHTDEQLA